MHIRQLVLLAHRWLGLLIAVVLVIVIASGAVLIWPGPFPFRRTANRLHVALMLGRLGQLVVIASTVLAVVVLIAGLVLWWKDKRIAVRTDAGWRRTTFDLHHAVGVFGFAIMFIMASTAMAMLGPAPVGGIQRVLVDLHTARPYPVWIKLVYTAGTLVFLLQVVFGVLMWWGRKGGTAGEAGGAG